MNHDSMFRRARVFAALSFTAVAAAGCGLTDVTDPTRIEEDDLHNATSTERLYVNALYQLTLFSSYVVRDVGYTTDELFVNSFSPTVWTALLDRRETELHDAPTASASLPWRFLAAARRRAAVAIPYLRSYASEEVRGPRIAEMFTVRGYATLIMAENICPGFPLNEAVDGRMVLGSPSTSADAFEAALVEFDSVAAYAGDSSRIVNLGRIGRARALLGLGRFAEAGAATAGVPTSFVDTVDQTRNPLWTDEGDPLGFSAGAGDGGNGIDFLNAGDPRIELVYRGKGWDGETDMYSFAKYPERTTPMLLANGIEARLIEAEAALATGDPAWLTILNTLRAEEVTPALPPLADPGDADARVDLLFRERAFWMYLTGRRLADLRRLIAHYGHDAEAVFPTGPYYQGGSYGPVTSLPFEWTVEAPHNPPVTGCTSY